MRNAQKAGNAMNARIGIAATEYASIARSIGTLDGQRSTYRDDLARTYIRAGIDAAKSVPVGKFDAKAFRKIFNSAARDAVRAEFSRETLKEYDSFDSKTLADRVAMHTDTNSAFRHADVADLFRALTVLKVRLSESFRLFTMYLDGESIIGGLLDGDVSVYAILNGLREKSDSKSGEKDAADAGESAYDLVKFTARIAAEIKRAEKHGFLPDALAKVAEMVGSLAAK